MEPPVLSKISPDDPLETDVEAAQFLPSPKSQKHSKMKLLKIISSVLLLLSFLAGALFFFHPTARLKGAEDEKVLLAAPQDNEDSGAARRWRLPPNPLRNATRQQLDAALGRFLQMVGEDLEPEESNEDETHGDVDDVDDVDMDDRYGESDEFAGEMARRLQGFGRKIRGGAFWNRYKAAQDNYELDPFGGISCYQTVFSCVWYLGYIGQGIDQLTLNQTCPDTSTDKGCSGGVMNVLQNLAWFLIAATQIPQYCMKSYTAPNSVNCFTSMTTFTGSGIEIAGDALSTVNDCAYLHQSPTINQAGTNTSNISTTSTTTDASGAPSLLVRGSEGSEVGAPDRSALPAPPWAMNWWLNNEASPPEGYGTNGNSGVPNNRASQKTLCAFQNMETVDDVLTVAMNLWAVVQTCMPVPSNPTGQESCASDLLAFIGSLPNVAQDIFNLMDACPLFYKLWAPCAADAADIAQCSLGVGAWAASVEQSCVA